MKRMLVLTLLVLSVFASSAGAVNDPRVPANECSASSTAVGHPAAANNQTPTTAANPPFSENNPGNSTGAQAITRDPNDEDNAQAVEHCPNAQE
jgi:hypothetical protein